MVEREERIPFQTGNKMEDMMGYARKLNALGDAISTIFWITNNKNVGEPELARFGEELGEIIMDYSQGLKIMLDESRRSIVDTNKDVVFPLGRCKEVYDFIGANRRKEDLCAVDYRLRELESFIENAALPAMRLKTDFEDLRKDILTGQKSASEAVSAAAGA